MNKLKIYLLLTILLASLITACAKPASQLSAAELLDLGEKYLLEMNYEQAVVCFTKLIAIEPKNPRGYTGLAEAYVGLGEFDKALDILRQGLGQLPDNMEIVELLEELEASAGDNGAANPATTPSSNADVTIDVHLTAAQLAFLKPLEEALLAFDPEAAAPILASAEFYELCRSLPKNGDEYITSGEYLKYRSVVDEDGNYSPPAALMPVASQMSKYKNVYKIDNYGIWTLGACSVAENDVESRSIVSSQSADIAVFDNLVNGNIMSAGTSVNGYGYYVSMEEIPIVNGYLGNTGAGRLVEGRIVDGKFIVGGELIEGEYYDYYDYEYEQSQPNR
jgi:tetratricopeptide (TPR) repeat protein